MLTKKKKKKKKKKGESRRNMHFIFATVSFPFT
jgi:hypothetical protein